MGVNYEVLSLDQLPPITNGPGYTIDFNLPSDTVIDDTRKAPIVTFQLDGVSIFPMQPYDNPNKWNIKLNVEVNGRKISSYRLYGLESNVERAMQEVMTPNRGGRSLNHGRNTLHFEIDEGQGMVHLSEVVIWYHTR